MDTRWRSTKIGLLGKTIGQECSYKRIMDVVLYEESAHENGMELST